MLSRLAENRLATIQQGSTTLATFVYDGDGNPSINSGHRRVKATVSGVTTTFIGPHFEWKGSVSTMVKYYLVYPESMRRAGSQRLAMRTGTGTTNTNLTWLFGDHLGSTNVTADLDGDVISRTLYKPWGGRKRRFRVRYQSGTLPTHYILPCTQSLP